MTNALVRYCTFLLVVLGRQLFSRCIHCNISLVSIHDVRCAMWCSQPFRSTLHFASGVFFPKVVSYTKKGIPESGGNIVNHLEMCKLYLGIIIQHFSSLVPNNSVRSGRVFVDKRPPSFFLEYTNFSLYISSRTHTCNF